MLTDDCSHPCPCLTKLLLVRLHCISNFPAATTGSYPSSRPSSGNSEDLFLSSVQYPSSSAMQTTASGSRLSDTSSASTDDSGISVSFEHSAVGVVGGNESSGGAVSISGPLESCTSSEYNVGSMFQSIPTRSQSELGTSFAPGHQVSISRAVEPPSTQSVQLPVFLADNLQQKITELKAATVVGPRFSVDPSIPSSSVGAEFRDSSAWTSVSASAYSVGVASGHPGISTQPKHQHQTQHGSREALATWSVAKPPAGGASKPRSASNLLYNMFSKTEDGTRWQCEECKRLFSSQGSLRAHARIHTGERPYQCQYCFRTFCQASTLRSHERLHTGEKPYKCEHCGRAFTQSAGLRSHLKTHRYDS